VSEKSQPNLGLAGATPLQIGAWSVDPNSGRISKDGDVIQLEARTARLLVYLAERAGTVVSIDEVLDQVWSGVIVTPDSVYQAIASLRRQLGDDPKRPAYIATIPRLGYRLIARVVPITAVPVDEIAPSPNPTTPLQQRETKKLGLGIGVTAACCLVAVALIGFSAMKTPIQRSVAVLPFADLTTQEMNEEFFADGLTEELIGDLGRDPELHVPAPTSSFYFKNKDLPIREMARQLSVNFIVDGSVRKAGSVYRVAARLVRADNGFVIWTNSYDRQLGDVVSIQKNIAAEAAVAIKESLAGAAAGS
jgi:TolB-like protein/DNA-binding winged helix-turn-helix (wHTH) protein